MSKQEEMELRSIMLRTKDENEVVCPRQKELPGFGLGEDKKVG